MRSIRQNVLPAPGPASTSNGLASASIASRCDGDATCGTYVEGVETADVVKGSTPGQVRQYILRMTRRHRIAVIPGDGIGTEVVPAGQQVLDRAAARGGFSIEWHTFDWSCERYARTGQM